jgi:predicted secreted hydrolase
MVSIAASLRSAQRALERAGASALLMALLLCALTARGDAAEPHAATPATFQRAEGTRDWRFPRDHGQHPAYRLEWWYWTGIVRADDGRTFGYQVTFFRQGLAGADPNRRSAWAVRSLYLAHAAVSDVAARRYLHASRVGRDSLGLSGAAPDALHVWLRDWRAEPLPDDPHGVRLHLDAGDFALALTLRAGKGPVLHGTGGLDRKGPQPGQASWYYSLPRLATEGTLRSGDVEQRVSGSTWMDHEFGTSQLAPELAGWDWLALRLEDGSDLMLYRLRRRDGSAGAFSGGSLVAPDGTRRALRMTGESPARAEMLPGRAWRSAASGAVYPLEWSVALPGEDIALRIAPAFDAQEQPAAEGTPFAYWEGAVWAEGTRGGRPLRGEGYLELTGYAGELGGALR